MDTNEEEERLTRLEKSCGMLDEAVDKLRHSNKVILDAITEMRVKNDVDYIKSRQDVYTVLFIPDGMKPSDVIMKIDRHFSSKELAHERIEHLVKTSSKNGMYKVLVGTIDTRV